VAAGDGVTERHLGRDQPSALPSELADHDGHESREAEDAKENGDSAQDANGAVVEENGKCNPADFLNLIRHNI